MPSSIPDYIRFRVSKTVKGDYTATSRTEPTYRADNKSALWNRIKEEYGPETTHH